MRRLALTAVVGLCLGLVLAVAACGGGDEGTTTSTSIVASPTALTAEIISPTEDTLSELSRARAYDFEVEVHNAVGTVSYEWTSGIRGWLSDEAAFTRWGYEFVAAWPDHVRVTVRDSAGNTASDEIVMEFPPNADPVVEILSPEDGATFFESQTISLTGQSFDADYPPDFQLHDGANEIGWYLDDEHLDDGYPFADTHRATLSGLSVGSHIIWLRGWDGTGGFSDVVNVTIQIEPDPVTSPSRPSPPPSSPGPPPSSTDPPPTATILSPAHGTTFTADAQDGSGQWYKSVTLTGQGIDSPDGTLSGASLVWRDSVNGGPAQVIGTGTSLTVHLGAPNTFGNTHLITLTVTDSHGQTGTDTISLTVSQFS